MDKLKRIPLLKDHHNHVSFYGSLKDCLNLQGVTDKASALKMLRKHNRNTVSVVLGWSSGFFQFTPKDLAGLPPLIIVNLSLHSFLMTPAAEIRLKGDYPEIVENYWHAEWYERRMPNMLLFLANQVNVTEEKIAAFFEGLRKKGVYYVEDMLLVSEEALAIIRSSPYAERTALWADLEVFERLSPSAREYVKGIKLFTDGALGAETAAIGKPYKSGSTGYLLFSDDFLGRQLERVAEAKKAVAIHAIGENGTQQTLRVLKSVCDGGVKFPAIRLEHAQFIGLHEAREAKKMGVILSMQPNFSMDSVDYADRLPDGYLERNNPFRMLIDQAGFVPGEDLIFGSDGMPHGAEGALRASLFSPLLSQRLTLEEFVAGYCMPSEDFGHIEFEFDPTKGGGDRLGISIHLK